MTWEHASAEQILTDIRETAQALRSHRADTIVRFEGSADQIEHLRAIFGEEAQRPTVISVLAHIPVHEVEGEGVFRAVYASGRVEHL